ncbi:MAG: DUF86 domain-containing protein [Bacteroidetes bacterium]|nr:DUF86 domain-containing protein [Bacteroidota bacterium]MBL6943596.1 DUF86 domain-containing protein [Bacteroidales bacterium]
MHRISHRDFSCIQNILESIKKIQEYSGKFENADEFFENTISFDASMMNFIVIGEMAEKLSPTFLKETENKIDWFKVKGFRNIIAHNYLGIDAEEVWQIIQSGIKNLKLNLEKEII